MVDVNYMTFIKGSGDLVKLDDMPYRMLILAYKGKRTTYDEEMMEVGVEDEVVVRQYMYGDN